MEDEWKQLEAEYASVCERLQNRVNLLLAVNKTIQDLEVWDPGSKETIINRANILQDYEEGLDFLSADLKKVAEKITESNYKGE